MVNQPSDSLKVLEHFVHCILVNIIKFNKFSCVIRTLKVKTNKYNTNEKNRHKESVIYLRKKWVTISKKILLRIYAKFEIYFAKNH